MNFGYGKYKLRDGRIATIRGRAKLKLTPNKGKEVLVGDIEGIPNESIWFASDGTNYVNALYDIIEFLRTEANYEKSATSLRICRCCNTSNHCSQQLPKPSRKSKHLP